MGSISQVWHWLIHVPMLGVVLLAAVLVAIVLAAAFVYDAWAQYNGR